MKKTFDALFPPLSALGLARDGLVAYISNMERRQTQHDFSRVGLFPLPNVVLFPHQLLPLHVFESRYRALVADSLESGRLIGVPRLRPGYEAEYQGTPRVQPVFGVGEILEHRKLRDGRYYLVLRGLYRVRLLAEHGSDPFRVVEVDPLPDLPSQANLAPLRAGVMAAGERLLRHVTPAAAKVFVRARALACNAGGGDYVEADLIDDPDERQALLEQRDPALRLTRLLELLGGLADHVEEAADEAPTTPDRSWN